MGQDCSDLVVSAPSCRNRQGFLTLASDLRVKKALGNVPIKRFNGNGWSKYHVSATLKVDQGEIMLICQVGIGYCPRLIEQVSLLSPTKPRSNASVPCTSARMMAPRHHTSQLHHRFVLLPPFSQVLDHFQLIAAWDSLVLKGRGIPQQIQ